MRRDNRHLLPAWCQQQATGRPALFPAEQAFGPFSGNLLSSGPARSDASAGRTGEIVMAILRFGTKFRDVMQGTDEAERFSGLEGDDTINGGGGNDYISGGQGRDILNGDDGDDEIHGGTEDDTISGGNGNDKLFGDEGNDTFKGDAGSDAIDGGTGIDTVDYSASRTYLNPVTHQPAGVQIDLADGLGGGIAAGDTFVSIENVTGSNYRDTITGSDVANVLRGQGGDDILNGGAGDDEIHGGTENDTISGGDGNDRLFGDEGNDTFTTDIGSDVINGGAGIDTVDYTTSRAYGIIRGYESGQYTGVDVNLQTGVGTGGDTYVSVENVIGSHYRDKITGSTEANFLSGLEGDDIISGGANNDTLDGGDGNDILSGDQGSDVMIGGAGADSFTFRADLSANASTDHIKDFEVGIDHIVFNDFTDGHVMMEQVAGGTLVWAEDSDMRSDSIMLWNVDAANLSAHMDTFLI
jgi:Ca2+-binding RTX toxin-like protein